MRIRGDRFGPERRPDIPTAATMDLLECWMRRAVNRLTACDTTRIATVAPAAFQTTNESDNSFSKRLLSILEFDRKLVCLCLY